MKNSVCIFLAALGMLLTACQPPPATEQPTVDLDALRTEIQAMEDAYAKASNEKNVDAIVAYYADDAQRLPDGAPIVKGKNAIRGQVRQEMASDTSGRVVSFQVLDVFADGNLAVEVGSYTGTAPDGSKEMGKYIAVYEKRDGKYVCIRDIWNSDTKDAAATGN